MGIGERVNYFQQYLMKRGLIMNNINERKIKRGDIYLYDFGDNEGSIQCGYRPVVVLQADNFNAKAPTIMVAAVTTAIRKTFLP